MKVFAAAKNYKILSESSINIFSILNGAETESTILGKVEAESEFTFFVRAKTGAQFEIVWRPSLLRF